MSVRLFHRGARLVIVVQRIAPGQERWWSPHVMTPDWPAIFARQLDLLGLPADITTETGIVSCRLGQVGWRIGRYWSTIAIQLSGGSEIKRRLVAAALLRAARYLRENSSIAKC